MVVTLYMQEDSTLLNEPDYNGEPLGYSVEGLSITSLKYDIDKVILNMVNASFGYLDPDHKEEFRAETTALRVSSAILL